MSLNLFPSWIQKKTKKRSNSIFFAHQGNANVFMRANKGNAEQGKASAEFHVGFGIASEIRPLSTLQVKKETWDWHMVWSHGTEIMSYMDTG